MTIKDSGSRTEFETGAVRDVQDDKGRCDLMPLRVIFKFYRTLGQVSVDEKDEFQYVFFHLANWKYDGETDWLHLALRDFSDCVFDTYDDMFLEVSMHFKQGAEKYGEYNWQKGIPTHSYLDSAVRHLLKVIRADSDERHDRAFVWNIMCLIWTLENKPELDDVRHDGKEDEE